MRGPIAIVAVSLALLLVPRHAAAQDTVFYKCTNAKGEVSMQNGTPCAPGMKQEIRRIGEVRTVPVPAAKPKAAPASAPPVRGDFVLVAGPTMQRTPGVLLRSRVSRKRRTIMMALLIIYLHLGYTLFFR